MTLQTTFRLVLRTPEKEVLSCDVHSLKVTTEGGEMMVLPGHADLSGSILFSRLEVKGDGFEEDYLVRRGLMFVSLLDKRTTIMAYACDKTEDMKVETVEEYLRFVEDQLKLGPEKLNQFQLTYLKGEKLAVTQHLDAVGKK